MYRKKLTPEEALESIKLRMKYDSSKTLNENKKLIYEQGLLQTAALALGFGPVSIDRAEELAKQGLLDTYFSKTSGTTSSQNPIMSIGKAFQKGVEKITQAARNLKLDVSCIGFNGEEYKEITTALVSSDGIGKPVHVWRFWPDGKAIYVESGDKYKYTYKCSKTKPGVVEITDVDSSQVDEYKLFDKKNSQTVAPKKAVPIPSELKDIEGVKNFQDWLDKKYLGWHDKYKALYRSIPKGYGKYGPRTQKWWKEKGQEYLDSLKVSTETEVTPKPTNTPAPTQQTTPFKPSASKGFSEFAQSQFGNSTAETNQKEKVADQNTKF